MKLALARVDGRRVAGLVDAEGSTFTPVRDGDDLGPAGLLDLFDRLDAMATATDVRTTAIPTSGGAMALDGTHLLAPIPRPRRNLICVGKNYHEHAEEFSRSGYDTTSSATESTPERPIFFTKAPTTVIGPDEFIDPHLDLTSELDYEAEIAIVLGRGGRHISRADAMKHVGWFTAANDVTARDLQRDHKQWFIGKSLDTFCPLGPWLVSRDEIDVDGVKVSCYVDDELRQQAAVADLIFDIPTIIATLSAGITLEPGDVILTGTPAGVGIGFSPPRFLQPGETIRVEVSGVGKLSNTIAR